MKNGRIISTIVICLIVISCKKSSSGGTNSFTVQYELAPASIYFTQVTYTDQNGQAVSVTDLSTFTNGKKEITVSNKPFTANLTTQMNNTTSATINYNLVISVDGQVKAVVTGSASPSATTTTTASYTVQ